MSCAEVQVQPNVFEMSSQETLPLTFDASDLVLEGESITSATATLTRVDTGVSYGAGILGTVAISGTDLTTTVTALQPRASYRLMVRFQVAVNKVWAPYLHITCPV